MKQSNVIKALAKRVTEFNNLPAKERAERHKPGSLKRH